MKEVFALLGVLWVRNLYGLGEERWWEGLTKIVVTEITLD